MRKLLNPAFSKTQNRQTTVFATLVVLLGACSQSGSNSQPNSNAIDLTGNEQSGLFVSSAANEELQDQTIQSDAPETLQSSANFVITTEQYSKVLIPVLELLHGDYFYEFITDTKVLPADPYIGLGYPAPNGFSLLEESNSYFADIGGIYRLYECHAGGTTKYSATIKGRSSDDTYTADECQVGSARFNGKRHYYVDDSIEFLKFDTPFTIRDTNDLTARSLQGLALTSNGGEKPIGKWELEHFASTKHGNLAVSQFESSLSVTRAPSAEKTFAAEFNVTSDWTNGHQIEVRTPTTFTNYAGALAYQTGELSIVADDGSSMVLNADSGDSSSFLLTITSNQSTSSFILNWSDTLRLPCAGFPAHNSEVIDSQGCRNLHYWSRP